MKKKIMLCPFLSEKMQFVYSIAERHLAIIEVHPQSVKIGALGYFMTIENIEEKVGSLDPKDWYNNQYFNKEKVLFEDLPIEDQIKLKVVLEVLVKTSVSQDHLETKCQKCGNLGDEFGDKILARKIT